MSKRISKKNILDLPSRRKIYDYVVSNPGVHFTKIRKVISNSRGYCDYHLKVLVDHGYLRERHIYGKRRFYLKKQTSGTLENIPRNQLKIQETLENVGYATQMELVLMTGIGLNAVVQNLKRLMEKGLVEQISDKKPKKYALRK